MATNRKTSLPASATVCSVSANRADDPVRAAAMPFAVAIRRLASSAARTLRRLWSDSVEGGGAWTLTHADTMGAAYRRRRAAAAHVRSPHAPHPRARELGRDRRPSAGVGVHRLPSEVDSRT